MTPKQEKTEVSETLRIKLEEAEEKISKLQKKRKDLDRKLEIQEHFDELSRHDTRNVLNKLLWSVGLLKSEKKELIRKIESYCYRIEKTLDSWKYFEELFAAEKFKHAYLSCSFLDAFYSHDPEDIENITIEIEENCDQLLVLSPLITRIFYNLIDNSFRHGEKVTKLRLACQKKEDRIVLSYQDNGIGISKENKEKIFEKGFSGGKGKSTGLGLYLTREIWRLYGGHIKETGVPNRGAEFIITLSKTNSGGQENYAFI